MNTLVSINHPELKFFALNSFRKMTHILLVGCILQMLLISSVHAASFLVSTGSDEGIGCELREAVEAINNRLPSSNCPFVVNSTFGDNDSIVIPPVVDTITLNDGPIFIETDMRIVKVGSNKTTIRRRGDLAFDSFNDSLIRIPAGGHEVELEGLRFYGGELNSSARGASIRIQGATLTVIDSEIVNGHAGSDGGGMYVDNAVVTIEDTVLSGNSMNSGDGGGIFALNNSTLTMNNSSVLNNIAGAGGGIYLDTGSVGFINDTTIEGNIATRSCGGICVSASSVLTVNRSLVHNNEAANSGGLGIFQRSRVSLLNSTVTANTSNGFGGGIQSTDGLVEIVNSTLTDNYGVTGAGYYASGTIDTLKLDNSIIANSRGSTDCQISSGIVVGINAGRNNIIEDGSCDTTALSVDPQLEPLADNGGPTYTHALQDTSPAISAGDNVICETSPIDNIDQRGEPRANPDDTICDLGAYESPEGRADTSFFVIPTKNGKTIVVEL